MSLRSRTIRRLSVLLGGLLVLIAVAAALYFHNEHVKAARLSAARSAGMTAFKSGDYRAALNALKPYIARRHEDNEALYAYGVSRSRIEEDNGRNIAEGISIFTSLLQQDPNNLAAKHDLLDLYLRAGRNKEASDLADRILAAKPDDLAALKDKCIALNRQHLERQALAVSQRLNELAPDDFEQQLATYQFMRTLKFPTGDVTARADKQLAAHPGDARFTLLAALAYGWSGDIDKGRALLLQAATRPASDAASVRYLVRVLDSQRLYRQANDVLNRAATRPSADPVILRLLAQRLWQNGKDPAVLDHLKHVDESTGDADLLAFRAMALFDLHQTDPAQRIVALLGRRSHDNTARAWSIALSAWFDAIAPKDALEKYRAALDRSPNNAIIRLLIGDAYARLGEHELAVRSWRRASQLAPSWATPHIRAAYALAEDGRTADAVAQAQSAFIARPDSLEGNIALATTQYQALEHGELDSDHESVLLALIEKIQKASPAEPRTLPIQVNLLIRAGRRDEAIAAVRRDLALPADQQNAPAIYRLLAASRAHQLGLENDLQKALNALGAQKDADPRITLDAAADLATSGRPQDGLALIDSRARRATTQPAQWMLIRARYLELIHDPSAAQEWKTLGDANPDDLDIQSAILRSADSCRHDRDFIARTIDRLKNLTGPDAQQWRIERARWLIDGNSSRDAAEAVNSLTEIIHDSPGLTRPRLLLARAYEKVGNISAATAQIQTASDLEPDNPHLALEAARLMQAQAQFLAARQYLERAVSSTELTPDERHRAALLFARQGDADRAIKLLQQTPDHPDMHSWLLLADLLRARNRAADAEAIYVKLLQDKPLSVEVIRAAADFEASRGQRDRAAAILARLPDATTRPATIALVQGEFQLRHGSTASAERHLDAATQAASDDPLAWRALVAYHLQGRRYDRAANTAEQALQHLNNQSNASGEPAKADLWPAPNAPSMQMLHTASLTLLRLSREQPDWSSALSTLASAATDDAGSAEVLSNWDASPGSAPSTAPADVLQAHLRDGIARFPRSLPLRLAQIRRLAARGHTEQAVQVASAAMDAFPAEADPCRLAVSLYHARRQFDLALAADQQWKSRAPADAQAADRARAEIQLDAGDAQAALKTLGPYAQTAIADPDANAALLATLLRAQTKSGMLDQTWRTLQPLLSKAKWRLIALDLAADDVPDATQASSWIDHVASTIPSTNQAEKVAVGAAWYHLCNRFDHIDADTRAAAVLDPIVKSPAAPLSAILIRAAVADRQRDDAAAESLYRRALKLSPDQPRAMNNLAYLLCRRGHELADAHQLAGRAVQLAPGAADYQDTLARVQWRQGDRAGAVNTFRRALQLDPDNFSALLGFASLLHDMNRAGESSTLLPRIDALATSHPRLPPELRAELDALHAAAKPSSGP